MQKILIYKFERNSTMMNDTLGIEDTIESIVLNAAKISGAKIDKNWICDKRRNRIMEVRFPTRESEVIYKTMCSDLDKYLDNQ